MSEELPPEDRSDTDKAIFSDTPQEMKSPWA